MKLSHAFSLIVVGSLLLGFVQSQSNLWFLVGIYGQSLAHFIHTVNKRKDSQSLCLLKFITGSSRGSIGLIEEKTSAIRVANYQLK